MKSFIRQYGLVVVMIAVGMVGYAVVRENDHALLDGSLTTIRSRLVAMIDDVPGREAIARHFDRFKEKVMAQEVSPEEVENMAANVLNLSNSGSTLTSEQAALMLDFAASDAEATLLPMPAASADSAKAPPRVVAAPTPPPLIEPAALEALAERLASMIAFDVEVHAATADRQELTRHIRYRVEGGLHIDIDAEMDEAMKQRLASPVERLEKRKMIVWKRGMAEEMQAEREHARHALRSVSVLKKRPPRDVRVAMRSLESLKHLETLGYRPLLSDSLKREINVHLEVALTGLGEDLEAVLSGQDVAFEVQVEAVEELLKDIEDLREVLEQHDDGR